MAAATQVEIKRAAEAAKQAEHLRAISEALGEIREKLDQLLSQSARPAAAPAGGAKNGGR